MPRKGDRHPPTCTQCDQQVLPQIHKGKLKGYHRTCATHFGYHHRPGANHPNATKGGRVVNDAGYMMVLDPRRTEARKKGSNYILEHRLIVEQRIGRRLNRNEVVHHLNGVRHDNRDENLALIGPGEKHEDRTYIKALQARVRELEALLAPR